MKAVAVADAKLAPDQGGLVIRDDVPVPQLPPNCLLVRVAFTALNRADTLQRKGLYPPPPGATEVLGLELAGVVEEVGEGVDAGKWRTGDRVMALVSGGSYAELCVVEEPLAMRLPPAMPLRLAASLPEAWLTAFQLLHLVGGVQRGDQVLIHAGASGVGLAAIQLAKEAGAVPICTASRGKHELIRGSLGVEHVIDYKAGPFVDAAKAATPDGRGVDLILDCVGGAEYTRQNLEALANGGRLVLYGTMSGSVVPEVDLRVIMRKALTIRGSTLRARPLPYKRDLVGQFWTEERALKFGTGQFKSHIHATLDWAEAGKAHAMMEANLNSGKILLTVDPSLE
jgi:tumor protein p53-inducible protein 3